MLFRTGVAAALFIVPLVAGSAAHADHAPVLVVPGRPDVPVFIDGVEASGAVVTGDWGLHRPGHGYRVIYTDPHYLLAPQTGSYFPSTGRRPRYGRQEIDHHRGPARPAATYYRSWSAQSGPSPYEFGPPFAPPPIIPGPDYPR